MYLPPAFAMDENDARRCIEATGAALLVTHDTGSGFESTVVPLLLRGHTLVGHVARANPIWTKTGSVLAVFTPLDGYISPSWYPSKQEHGRVVPTWNYATVQVHGVMRSITDIDRLREIVVELTNHHEERIDSSWRVSDAPTDFIDAQLRAIVGIEIAIERIEGKAKLSQNRSDADIDGVIAAAPAAMGAAVRSAAAKR